jgi:hypothetical protein
MNTDAARKLGDLLVDCNRIDELRAEVDAGTSQAGEHLIKMLVSQGEIERADQLRRNGIDPDN